MNSEYVQKTTLWIGIEQTQTGTYTNIQLHCVFVICMTGLDYFCIFSSNSWLACFSLLKFLKHKLRGSMNVIV